LPQNSEQLSEDKQDPCQRDQHLRLNENNRIEKSSIWRRENEHADHRGTIKLLHNTSLSLIQCSNKWQKIDKPSKPLNSEADAIG